MIRSLYRGAAALACSLALAAGAMAATGHMTKERAQREIVGDGYTGVANLHQTKSGWEASALESGKPVTVRVANNGSVEKVK